MLRYSIQPYVKRFILSLLAVGWFTSLLAQSPKAPNFTDKNGNRQGKWIIYLDSLYQPTLSPDQFRLYRLVNFKDDKLSGQASEHFLNGTKRWEGKISNLQPLTFEGQVKNFHPNGQLSFVINYSEGKASGKSTGYYEFGELNYVANYKDGRFDGEYIEYYQNGNVKSKKHYRFGSLKGAATEFYENGRVKSTGVIVEGKKEGQWTYFKEDGTIDEMKEYSQDVPQPNHLQKQIPFYENKTNGLKERIGTHVIYFDENWRQTSIKGDAQYYRIITYEHNKPVETVKDFYLSGKLQWSGKLVSDEPDVIVGKSISYHENGKLSLKEKYKNGKKEGKSISYYENGQEKEIIKFKAGKKNGKAEVYYPNGKLKRSLFFVEDREHGKESTFYDDGSPKSTASYNNGMPAETWKWYELDGTIKNEVEYFGNGMPPVPVRYGTKYESELIGQYKKEFRAGKYKAAIVTSSELADSACSRNKKGNNCITGLKLLAEGYSATGYEDKSDSILKYLIRRTRKSTFQNVELTRKRSEILASRGLYKEAQNLLKSAITNFESITEKPHPLLAKMKLEIGLVMNKRGVVKRSQRFIQEALDLYEKVGTDNSLEYIKALKGLGEYYLITQESNNAKINFYKALRTYKENYGTSTLSYASILKGVGDANLASRDFEIAKKYYEEALLIRLKKLDQDHPDYGESLVDLANVHREIGELDRAELLLIKALKSFEQVGGFADTRASLFTSLGYLYLEKGESSKAHNFFERGFQLKLQYADTVMLGIAAYEFAKANQKEMQLFEASFYFKRALMILNKQLGELHPFTVSSNISLAENLIKQRYISEGESILTSLQQTLEENELTGLPQYEYLINLLIKLNLKTNYEMQDFRKLVNTRLSFLPHDTLQTPEDRLLNAKLLCLRLQHLKKFETADTAAFLYLGSMDSAVADLLSVYYLDLVNSNKDWNSKSALKFFEGKNVSSEVFNRLGRLYGQNDPLKSIEFYLRADAGFSNRSKASVSGYLNNLLDLAKISIELKKLNSAQEYLKKAVEFRSENESALHPIQVRIHEVGLKLSLARNDKRATMNEINNLIQFQTSLAKSLYHVDPEILDRSNHWRNLIVEGLAKYGNQQDWLKYFRFKAGIEMIEAFNHPEIKCNENKEGMKIHRDRWVDYQLRIIHLLDENEPHFEEIDFLKRQSEKELKWLQHECFALKQMNLFENIKLDEVPSEIKDSILLVEPVVFSIGGQQKLGFFLMTKSKKGTVALVEGTEEQLSEYMTTYRKELNSDNPDFSKLNFIPGIKKYGAVKDILSVDAMFRFW